MNQRFNLKSTTLGVRNWIGPTTTGRSFLLVALALAWFTLSPAAQAVTPAPDGGYPNNTTAEGHGALFGLTSGTDNSADGAFALHFNTTGNNNTAQGAGAMVNNTSGNDNTAMGLQALYFNTTGGENTAVGSQALQNNLADDNTAIGYQALLSNNTGRDNTATGWLALFRNTSGTQNTAIGIEALIGNTTGGGNTAIGAFALQQNTFGSNNIAVGYFAGTTNGRNNIDIGAGGPPGESFTIRIGTEAMLLSNEGQTATFIAGIFGETTSDAASTTPVVIDMNGKLGTAASAERFKTEIKPMDKGSEAILSFKPVTFHYKNDSKATPQFGLVAEEVEKVNPDLVARDAQGRVYTVRYEAVNAMLLNEFLKAHGKLEEQQDRIDRQQKQIDSLTARVQKVSEQLEVNKPAPQIVANSQ
jgi:hypothetical protein